MRITRASLLVVALLLCAFEARAAGMTIGVVAPRQGNFALLGAQIIAGAEEQIRADGNTSVAIDETCDENSGNAVVDALLKAKATVAIGFLCSETLESALPRLKDAAIPAITVSVRSRILMEDAIKNGWPFLRLAPSEGDEARKIIDVILRDWSSAPIALIDDGTIHARELVDALRNALEGRGLKPVFTDTFRPGQDQQIALVRRLKRAGATRVFIGGDRRDVSIIVRDANAEKLALSFMGGDAMRAADQPVPLADGVRAIVLPDANELPQSQPIVAQLRAQGTEPEGYTLAAAAAAAIAGQAGAIPSPAGKSPLDPLIGRAFQTPAGTVTFGPNHELAENPYRLMEWRSGAFVPVGQPTQ